MRVPALSLVQGGEPRDRARACEKGRKGGAGGAGGMEKEEEKERDVKYNQQNLTQGVMKKHRGFLM